MIIECRAEFVATICMRRRTPGNIREDDDNE